MFTQTLNTKRAKDYFQTKSGIMSLVLLVLNIVNFVCVVSESRTSIGNAFMGIAISGFILTSAFVVIYFFYINEKLSWPWPRLEIIYTEIWMVLYLVVSAFVLNIGRSNYIAAGIFGLFTAIVYTVKSLHIYITQIVVEASSFYVRT